MTWTETFGCPAAPHGDAVEHEQGGDALLPMSRMPFPVRLTVFAGQPKLWATSRVVGFPASRSSRNSARPLRPYALETDLNWA